MPEKSTYKDAGVDIDAGELFAQMIRKRVAKVWPEAASEIGGFAGGGPIPVGARKLVGSTDGPGTKIILAAMVGDFSGIGQDVTAMSAVDTYVSGRRPRYLWDSLKVAKLIPDLHIQIIDSIIEGCRQAGCILVGGETAEMPDLYKYDWMADVDTFVIGFPDPELEFVPVRPGQEVWGWPSFGVCANGFSLVRKVFKLKEAPSMARRRLERKWSEFDGLTLAEELMRPTPIWIKTIEEERERGVKFARHAHITGGGMPGNIPRILPANCKVIIHRTNWIRPTVFPLIQLLGSVPDQEMDRTFNQGVIVVSIVEPDGETIRNGHAFFMGEIEERQGDEPQVILSDTYSDHEGLLFQKGGKS